MRGAKYYLFSAAVLFLVLTACQFDEPSLEIDYQQAYPLPNVTIHTRFTAENDEHKCEYDLIRQIDSNVIASESLLLPAETWNPHNFNSLSDGKYLFDFQVLDTGDAPIGCLCDDAEFWVDTVNPAAPEYSHADDSVAPDRIVYLMPHPDNAIPDSASPVDIFYLIGVAEEPRLNSEAIVYDPDTGIYVNTDAGIPNIYIQAIDRAGNYSGSVTIHAIDYY